MKLSLIVAMATNQTIGLDKKMPWHLSADLKKFKQITLGHSIIMGRKTFESIGRPLPERKNIIVSREKSYQQTGCFVFNDIDDALKSCRQEEEVFVIGGATLYEAMLGRANKLYITEVKKEFKGDTYFPMIDKEQWREIEREDVNNDDSVNFDYSFVVYER